MKYIPIILFLIFLTLKLACLGIVANWSWWVVCIPLYIEFLQWGYTFYLLLKLEALKKRAEANRPLSGWQKKLADMKSKNQ